jgi:cyclohexanone monooxygenase
VFDVDVIIFATGYDAMTGTLLRLNVTGRGGLTLGTAWADGPQTYLGITVHGFPNFFVIAGPGSPSVLSNVILAIEQHVEWIGNLLDHGRVMEADVVEAHADAQEQWTRHVLEAGERSFVVLGNSWWRGPTPRGSPRL